MSQVTKSTRLSGCYHMINYLVDYCEPEDAVRLFQNAGVKVCMDTGDNLKSARVIALECGIHGSDAKATEPNLIEGKSFCALSDAQREEVAENICVFSSLLPCLCSAEKGHIVDVTGDGTNDSPALYEHGDGAHAEKK
ncbi:hypothetical protein SAY86_030516 [Trapa natans]|uniref:Uncharacterized protein n=1 Tax=Trapa natans TaxID=22666 RepID=A0AAN7MN01_TRANT|nr:hypothetical protein SAY86_030516 [Trapa natans]